MNNEVKQVSLDELFPLIEEQIKNGGSIVFHPRGISMLPLIRQGIDRVELSRPSAPLKKYDIPFYRREDGSFILHRIVNKHSDGTYTMCGDNQIILEHGVTNEQIIGVVTGVYKGEKLYSITSAKMRFYCLYAVLRRKYRKTFFCKVINWGLRKCRLKR